MPRPFLIALLALGLGLSGCTSLGPQTLDHARLQYNEVIKRTTEEQLLLNIVRLRYTDTPSSLAVSAIAAQFERSQSVGLLPFFTAAGGDLNRSFTAVLPQAQIMGADRPTFSLTPLDDQEFTRKLFTPLPLDGVIYLAKTTWPISKVFRLYLENLNWVPNAETASGPTPRQAPPAADFLRGIAALQSLQDRGALVFGMAEQEETLGGALPAGAVAARDLIEAARSGMEYRPDASGRIKIGHNHRPEQRRHAGHHLGIFFQAVDRFAVVPVAIDTDQHLGLDLPEAVEHALHAEIRRGRRPDGSERAHRQHGNQGFRQVGQVAGHPVAGTDAGVDQEPLEARHLGIELGPAHPALDLVLAPEDQGFALVTILQQILGIVEACLGKPAGARHPVAIAQHRLALVADRAAKIPQL